MESGRQRPRPHRRLAQGHRSQALRVRFSRCRSPGLAAEHLARDADPHRGCDPRFDWNRPFIADWRVEAIRGRDRRRPRANRRARSRILCRRSLVPGGQNPALPGPAGGNVDLRGLRHVRSGAARTARPSCSEIRRRNRPRQNAELRPVSIHARGRPYPRRARRLLAVQERLG